MWGEAGPGEALSQEPGLTAPHTGSEPSRQVKRDRDLPCSRTHGRRWGGHLLRAEDRQVREGRQGRRGASPADPPLLAAARAPRSHRTELPAPISQWLPFLISILQPLLPETNLSSRLFLQKKEPSLRADPLPHASLGGPSEDSTSPLLLPSPRGAQRTAAPAAAAPAALGWATGQASGRGSVIASPGAEQARPRLLSASFLLVSAGGEFIALKRRAGSWRWPVSLHLSQLRLRLPTAPRSTEVPDVSRQGAQEQPCARTRPRASSLPTPKSATAPTGPTPHPPSRLLHLQPLGGCHCPSLQARLSGPERAGDSPEVPPPAGGLLPSVLPTAALPPHRGLPFPPRPSLPR